jgi:uncharacterized protein YjdB
MNKKVILLPLASVLAFGLVSCGGTSSSKGGLSVDNSSSSNSQSASNSNSASTDTRTAKDRHDEYIANNGDDTKVVTIQGKCVHKVAYSGNTTANIAIQEGVYGYWVNNVPDTVEIGKSYRITAHGAKKTYPALNASASKYTDAVVTEISDVAAPVLTLGAAGNVFADSQDALTVLPAGGAEITAVTADAKGNVNGLSFMIGTATCKMTFNSGVVQAADIITKLAGLKAGKMITALTGIWYAADTVSICSAADITISAEVPAAKTVVVTGAASIQSLAAGATAATSTYTAAVSPDAAAQDVVWSVTAEDGSATTAATISDAGVLTAALGLAEDANIKVVATAKDTTIKGELAVTVLKVPTVLADSVTVTAAGSATSVEIGATLQLTAAALPAEAKPSFTWKSSNEKVATVDANGLVTAILDGAVTITATAGDGSNKEGTIALTVTNSTLTTATAIAAALSDTSTSADALKTSYTVKGVVIASSTTGTSQTSLISDGTKAFQIYLKNDLLVTGKYVEVTSKFKLYSNLLETAGSTTIVEAQSNDKPTIAAATAITAADLTTLGGNNKTDFAGQQNTVADARISNGTLVVNGSTFVGSTMYINDGFTAPAEGVWGTFTVVMMAHGTKGTQIFITGFTKNDPVPATAVTVSAAADSVEAGSTVQLSAVPTPVLSDYTFTWTVEGTDGKATALATIDANGLLTAVTAGSVVVRATSTVTTTISGTKTITITAADPTKLYSSGFESAEGFTASTTYNNTSEVKFGPDGKQWGTLSGTAAADTTCGSAQTMQMRYYSSNTFEPETYMLFDVAGAMSISFDYYTSGGYTGKLSYSTDKGTTWTVATTFAAATSSTAFKYNFTTAQTQIRFKITEVAATTVVSKSKLGFDNVLIKTVAQ